MTTAGTRSRLRIRRIAPGEDARAWRDALAAFDAGAGGVIKEDEAAAVHGTRMLGRDVVVKRWTLNARARFKALVHAWRGDRHWRGAAWLMGWGFATARPLVLAMERGPGVSRQWLVMERLEGRTLLEHLADGDLSVRREHALANAVGTLTVGLYHAGRFNRDHKPSNVIVTRHGGELVPALIDCVGLRRFILDDDDKIERMFASLYIEALGCRCPPRRTLIMRAILAAEFRYADGPRGERTGRRYSARRLWETAAERVCSQGDPRPLVNPLATRVKARG